MRMKLPEAGIRRAAISAKVALLHRPQHRPDHRHRLTDSPTRRCGRPARHRQDGAHECEGRRPLEPAGRDGRPEKSKRESREERLWRP
jgi:hypothetical protein